MAQGGLANLSGDRLLSGEERTSGSKAAMSVDETDIDKTAG
jgi:hypothetical protein